MPRLACATRLYIATAGGISPAHLASIDLSSSPLLALLGIAPLSRALPMPSALPALTLPFLSDATSRQHSSPISQDRRPYRMFPSGLVGRVVSTPPPV